MSTQRHHQRRGMWAALAALLVGAAVTVGGQRAASVRPAVRALQQPRLCDTHATLAEMDALTPEELTARVDTIMRRLGREGLTPDDLNTRGILPPLVGTRRRSETDQDQPLLWRSPQYHDCQDLIVEAPSGERYYTTRAGLMTTIETQLVEEDDFTNNPNQGHRLLFVRRLAGADYANLQLTADSACVYVGAGSSISEPWWAALGDCAQGTITKPNTVLQVTRLTYDDHNFQFMDYPPSARWEWDVENRVQAYGVKCAVGWCVIGARRPTIDMREFPTGNRPHGVIHGWRDEQFLAETTTVHPEDGAPSDLYAVIVPRGLDLPDLDQPRDVGFIQVDSFPGGPASAQYNAKYGFSRVGRYPVRLGGNRGTTANGRDTTQIVVGPCPACGGIPVPRAIRINPLGATPIQTVRWAWALNDEEQWYGCPDGCCESGKGPF